MTSPDLFGVEATQEPSRWTWSPSHLVVTPAGNVQGGACLGVAGAAMEAATGRPLVWITGQYLSFAPGTGRILLDVTVEAHGRSSTQARCIVSRDNTEILVACAALGSRDGDLDAVWTRPPAVPTPSECPPFGYFDAGAGDIGDLVDLRLARGRQLRDLDGSPGSGNSALWVRVGPGAHQMTAPVLALIGDLMPTAFADAAGGPIGGHSLDNTVRVGRLVGTEWALLACQVQQIVNGFGHGRAEIWAEDGTLLGTVNQTTALRRHARLTKVARDDAVARGRPRHRLAPGAGS